MLINVSAVKKLIKSLGKQATKEYIFALDKKIGDYITMSTAKQKAVKIRLTAEDAVKNLS